MSSFADDSSDDDIPIAQLLAKKKAESAPPKASKPKPKAKAKGKDGSSAKKASTSGLKAKAIKPSAKSSSSSKPTPKAKSSSSSNSIASKTAEFYATEKGKLVHKFLVRWWYAMDWPDVAKIGAPPPGYETLDGFPGVFVGTSVDNLGNLVDKRDKATCPNLKNMAKKTSQELKDLCEKALEEQIRQLKEEEGDDTELEVELRKELREVKAVNVNKADKSAAGIAF